MYISDTLEGNFRNNRSNKLECSTKEKKRLAHGRSNAHTFSKNTYFWSLKGKQNGEWDSCELTKANVFMYNPW